MCVCVCVRVCMRVTFIIVGQVHTDADVVGQRAQVLHQHVELPHQQDAGLLSGAVRHGCHRAAAAGVLPVVVAKTREALWEINASSGVGQFRKVPNHCKHRTSLFHSLFYVILDEWARH